VSEQAIQDADGGGAGAVPGAGPGENGNIQVYPFYERSGESCPGAIFLLPPSFTYGGKFEPSMEALSVRLLYRGSKDRLPAPITSNGDSNPADFTLELTSTAQPGSYGQGNVTAAVTITGVNAWACEAAKRQLLMRHFEAFLVEIEALEASGDLVAGAGRLIGGRIADLMPAPLEETLFWRYSLSPGTYPGTLPYVDVRPGMRLRLDAEVSQFVDPGAPLNGYVAGPRLALSVGSSGVAGPAAARVVSFDALLGAIKAPLVAPPQGAPAATAVAAGPLDLDQAGGARPYWRLIYPPSVSSPLDPGSRDIAHNVVLLGAPSLAALEKATAAYPALDAGGVPPNVYLIFLGRALVAPEIQIFLTLRGVTTYEWVPLGTTLANLMERYTVLPLAPDSPRFTFARPSSASISSGPTAPLTLTTKAGNASLTALPPAIFDIPLIAGDGITLTV
jgi:hypothetical protein